MKIKTSLSHFEHNAAHLLAFELGRYQVMKDDPDAWEVLNHAFRASIAARYEGIEPEDVDALAERLYNLLANLPETEQ